MQHATNHYIVFITTCYELLHRISIACYEASHRNILGIDQWKSLQLAPLWRQVAPLAFTSYLVGTDEWTKTVQLAAPWRQVAHQLLADYYYHYYY